MRKALPLSALPLTFLLALAACGDDGLPELADSPTQPPADATTPAAATSPDPAPAVTETTEPTEADATEEVEFLEDACALATEEAVGEIVGEPVEFADRGLGEGAGGREDVCYYHFGGFSEIRVGLATPFSSFFNPAADDGVRFYENNASGEEISGVGDEATWSSDSRSFYALQDGVAVEINFSPSMLPDATPDEVREVATALGAALIRGAVPQS